jgi:hypothetical protein
MINIKYDFLNGKQVVYHDKTIFLVQWGRNKKSKYDTLKIFRGNLAQAVMWYNMLNIRAPHKKRLISSEIKPPVLAREQAY